MSDPDPKLDEDHVKALVQPAKRQIRERMRRTRQAYPLSAVATRSQSICDRLATLPIVQSARSVALFAPLHARREVDLGLLDRQLRAQGKALYYPFLEPTSAGFRTGFRRVERPEDLAPRGQVFPEPLPDAADASRGDVDVVVVPALAVAANGHRVGYGMGYYDATLPDIVPPAVSIVVAFDFQLLGELPHEAHDQPCDWIVTDKRAIYVSAGGQQT